MNNRDSELLRKMMRAALHASAVASLVDLQNDSKIREDLQEAFRITGAQRRHLEHHPSIKTDITDRDMLLLHIDMALDTGDNEMFMLLTDELRGMEVLV